MEHLNQLSKALKAEPIDFLFVTDEECDSVLSFMGERRIEGWVGCDTDRSTFVDYKVTSLPYTLLIDANGIVRAITYADGLDESALKDLIHGRDLKVAKRREFSERFPDLFSRVPEPLFHVMVRRSQAEKKGIQTGSSILYAQNMTLQTVLANAFHVSRARVRVPSELSEVGLDVAVSTGRDGELRDRMIVDALSNALGIKISKERKRTGVMLLKADPSTRERLPAAAGGSMSITRTGGVVSGFNVSLGELAKVLEDALGVPVVERSGLEGRYDVELEWDEGDESAMMRALREKYSLILEASSEFVELVMVERG
jgi:uncharacterized protein (TIGR03435 family)